MNEKNFNVYNERENDSSKTKKIIFRDNQKVKTLIDDMEMNYLFQQKQLKLYSEEENDLCNSTGITCVKYSHNEYTFEFSVYEDDVQVETYSVQFFKCSNQIQLGKLKIPIGMDMKRILSETPLDSPKSASKFLNNCKRYTYFYYDRKKQFDELQTYIKNARNCFVHTNYNYSLITLQFMKVYNTISDIYYNIIIYLIYDLVDTKPIKIKIENNNEELEDSTYEHLKSYLECFKTLNLKEALCNINNENETSMQWELKQYDDHLLYSNASLESNKSDKVNMLYNKNIESQKKKGKKRKSKGKHSMIQTKLNFLIGRSKRDNANERLEDSDENSPVKKNRHKSLIKTNKKKNSVERNKDKSKVETNTEKESVDRYNDKTVVESNETNDITKKDKKKGQTKTNKKIHDTKIKKGDEIHLNEKYTSNALNENSEENNCKNSEDGCENSKADDQVIPSSTPLQIYSKSLLKRPKKQNLDISNITRTEPFIPILCIQRLYQVPK